MPEFIKQIGSTVLCNHAAASFSFALSESDSEQIIVFGPFEVGTWRFTAGVISGIGAEINDDMLRVDIHQVGICGFFESVEYNDISKKSPAFIYPCDSSPPCSAPLGYPGPYATQIVPYDIYGGIAVDCCDGGSVEVDFDPHDTECPETECTLMGFKIRAYKRPGSGVFSVAFGIDAELIAPPP